MGKKKGKQKICGSRSSSGKMVVTKKSGRKKVKKVEQSVTGLHNSVVVLGLVYHILSIAGGS